MFDGIPTRRPELLKSPFLSLVLCTHFSFSTLVWRGLAGGSSAVVLHLRSSLMTKGYDQVMERCNIDFNIYPVYSRPIHDWNPRLRFRTVVFEIKDRLECPVWPDHLILSHVELHNTWLHLSLRFAQLLYVYQIKHSLTAWNLSETATFRFEIPSHWTPIQLISRCVTAMADLRRGGKPLPHNEYRSK